MLFMYRFVNRRYNGKVRFSDLSWLLVEFLFSFSFGNIVNKVVYNKD